MTHEYTGRLQEFNGAYVQFVADEAPLHLRTILLQRWTLHNAQAGDRVKVEYRRNGAGYGYEVTEVL